MINRINELIERDESFAFETTLSSKHYRRLIIDAQAKGYYVTLLYFWLESVDLAKTRVATRVKEGGHNIAPDVIERRYKRGILNLFNDYLILVDNARLFDNSEGAFDLIAKSNRSIVIEIVESTKFEKLRKSYDEANKK